MRTSSYMLRQPATHFSDGTVDATFLAFHHGEGEQRYPSENSQSVICKTLIGSRALAAYGDVDGSSAANNHPWSRKCTARLFRSSDTSSRAYGCAGTHGGQLA